MINKNAKKTNPENWMETLYPIIKDQPLKNIVLPGVHHPASYSFMIGDTGKYITQNTTFYTQLMNGIRYFDSRPAVYEDQIVEYHGDKNASYGASYNTILRQFNDYFRGYDSLVDFGSAPSVMCLSNNRFAVIYHSKRVAELSDNRFYTKGGELVSQAKTRFSIRLFFKIGEYDSKNNSVKWQESQAYNYGITPDAVITKNGIIVEVHQSQNNDGLYYTLGKVLDDKPTFDLRIQGKYTEGTQPSIGKISDPTSSNEHFLEVHKSKNNNTLWYKLFNLYDEHLAEIDSGEVAYSGYSLKGYQPKQLQLPNSKNSIVFYSDTNGNITYFVASAARNKIQLSKPVTLETSDLNKLQGNSISLSLLSDTSNSTTIAISYNSKFGDFITRGYAILTLDSQEEVLSCNVTDFSEKYPTWNARSAALLYQKENSALLSFESDADLLSNIWYQPLNINKGTISIGKINHSEQAKNKEFCILDLSHNKVNEKKDLELFSKLFSHFIPDSFLPFNSTYKLSTTPLKYYLEKQFNLIVIFDINSDKITNLKCFWPQKERLSSPWHSQKELNKKYYDSIYKYITQRTNNEYKDQIYVLQTHLT